jgi:hypothetical protein
MQDSNESHALIAIAFAAFLAESKSLKENARFLRFSLLSNLHLTLVCWVKFLQRYSLQGYLILGV